MRQQSVKKYSRILLKARSVSLFYKKAIKKRAWETPYYDLVFKWSGRQYSNLRPSAPKALNNLNRALCLQAIT